MYRYNPEYDDDVAEDVKIHRKQKKLKPPKEQNVNRRMCRKLDTALDKDSLAQDSNAVGLIEQMSYGASLSFNDNSKIENKEHRVVAGDNKYKPSDVKPNDNPEEKANTASRPIKIEYTKTRTAEETASDISKKLGLKFVIGSKLVLKLFTDSLNVPLGSKFMIYDQYFENGCLCMLDKVLYKNQLIFVFKKVESGGYTTYSTNGLKDVRLIEYVQ